MTYVASCPWTFSLRQYQEYVTQQPLLAELNRIFVADYGYVFFTVAYFAFLAAKASRNRHLRELVYTYLIQYGIIIASFTVLNLWFWGPLVFDRINIFFGGRCLVDQSTVATCDAAGGVWTGGYDVSGHYYFLVTVSLSLWREVLEQEPLFDLENSESDNMRVPKSSKIAVLMALGLLAVWYAMFLVTSLFFHTLSEKLAGLAIGTAAALVAIYAVDHT